LTDESLSDLVEGFCPACRSKLRLLLKRIAGRLDALLIEIRRSEGEEASG